MENSRPIQYNLDDIKRYRQGLMNREEMHAFEKASMEDPFLSDALEGYMEADMAQADEHLHNIREKITGQEAEKEKAVVVTMPARGFAMWKVAAMIIIIGGIGLLVYKIFDNKNIVPADKALAKVETSSSTLDSGIQTTPNPDDLSKPGNKEIAALPNQNPGTIDNTPGNTNNSIAKTNIDTKEKNNAVTGDNKNDLAVKDNVNPVASAPYIKQESKIANQTADKNATTTSNEDAAKLAELQERNNRNLAGKKAYVTERNEIRGRVLNPSNQPLANANVTLDRSKRSFITDPSGNFTFNANDTVLTATVVSEGYDNTRVQLRSNTDNTINLGNIMLQRDASAEEVVVIGLGTDKKRVTDTISNKPLGGWQSFQEYVANKLNTIVDTSGSDARMTGELELEFFVDAKGTPKNFKILNLADANISKEAIEAVKQGPKWEIKRKKTRLLIKY
jgi:hypothetical protein